MLKTTEQQRYRIYTENIENGVFRVQEIVNFYFEACTVIESHGVYKGERENGLIIEIITSYRLDKRIENICDRINKLHKQECCMVTVEAIETVFIS
jgi:hypothetical protein